MTRATDHVPAYTADHPAVPDRDSLQARIPGWGADLDKKDRPSVPKLKFLDTGAWWISRSVNPRSGRGRIGRAQVSHTGIRDGSATEWRFWRDAAVRLQVQRGSRAALAHPALRRPR